MSKKLAWRTALTTALAATMLTGCGANALGLGGARAAGALDAQGRKATKSGFTPKWVKDAIFYQIFPERFANGNKANDPKGVQPWGSKPTYDNFMGGDLAGVRSKIPYMKSLGINAIYFNPLFKASSNHKYNTADYMQIDPAFGTNAEFKSLIGELHSNGIKVVIDGVFNHTGDDHVWFEDCKKNGPKSKYWDFYSIWGFPVTTDPKPNYSAWWGFGTLPQLTGAKNREVQQALFDVTEYWTKQGIDGWRLDVPNELDNRDFWREWRKKVRAINPEAYIVGEIWTDGHSWLQGDQFDAVMNYLSRETMLEFFAYQKMSVDELDSRQSGLRSHYGQEVTEASFNILSSHDVPRVRSEAGGDLKRAKEAYLYNFTQPGTPVLYYGDELGMHGAKDPDNRQAMPWGEATASNDMLGFMKKLIAVRKAHPALRGGETKTLMRHNQFRQFAYLRADKGEKLVVALNSGAEARNLAIEVKADFADGAVFQDLIGGKKFTVVGGKLNVAGMAAQTGAILAPAAR